MTVESILSSVKYVADGVTAEFSVPYVFFTNKDGSAQLAVYVSSQYFPCDEGTDYSVIYNNNGGIIKFATAPEQGVIVAIIRQIPPIQDMQFMEGGKFPATAFERALDYQMMLIQQLDEKISRCLELSPTDSESSKSIKDQILEQLKIISKTVEDAKKAVDDVAQSVQTATAQAEIATAKAAESKQCLDEFKQNAPKKYADIAVTSNLFVADETYSDYPFKADIALADALVEHVPTVNFGLEQCESGNFAPVASAGNGYVRIYAKAVPETGFVIPVIILQ